jgi:hypothetical protein
MKSLEHEIDAGLFSHIFILTKHYFPKKIGETINMYTRLLVDYYQDLKNLNPELDKEWVTELAYGQTFEGLIEEGKRNLPN